MIFADKHRELVKHGDQLFSERKTLVSLWQDLAENFYVERADFTYGRVIGDDFAGNLDTSFPIMARRDLGNLFGAMLRPPGKQWFHVAVQQQDGLDEAGRGWLEMATRVQTRALYDIESGFVRATKEGDHDFATFGQCVLTSEPAFSPTSGFILLHRDWHLRDVAWSQNSYGVINHIQRQWKPTARELKNDFRHVHEAVRTAAEKEPFQTFNCRHIVIASHDFETNVRTPWVSLYLDLDNEFVMEEVGSPHRIYVIPRWETVSGSQYAYSPAAIAALPDARLLQAMTYTLLTAGEYAVEPALIGVQEAIKSGIEMFPGGFTAVDAQYDERLGEVVRPLYKGGEKSIPLGLEMNQDIRLQITESFFLNTLALPDPGLGGMSPFEVSQRIEEFIRRALPLFEPMESDYNGALMEQNFEILLRAGAFGPPQNIPESLRGRETEFRFESPLRESIERLKGQQFLESKQLVLEGAELDPANLKMLNARIAQRDALHGIRTPATWLRSEEELDQVAAETQQMEELTKLGAIAGGGAEIAKTASEAVKNLSQTPAE